MSLRALAFIVTTFAALVATGAAAQGLSAQERREVVTGAAELIETRYVYPDKGREIATALRADVEAFDQVEPDAFAAALTQRLRALSNDGHFAVEHRPDAAGNESREAIDGAHLKDSLERWYGVGVNHGFESVRRLEDGIGYLDLRVFAPVDMGGDLMAGAMSLLAQSPALIIDLRHNGGGMDDAVSMLAAYLLDGSAELSGIYDRPSDQLSRTFTPSWVPGRRFGPDKPVYILTSRRTFSAAEAFAYDMQAMKRAVVVGERSGGGAHPFEYRSITPNFVLSLPEKRSVSPITGRNWEGQGVIPDVETSADRALAEALTLAKTAIAGRD